MISVDYLNARYDARERRKQVKRSLQDTLCDNTVISDGQNPRKIEILTTSSKAGDVAVAPEIVLTSDRTLMSNYHNNEFLGFGTCAPHNFIPD